LTSSDFETAIEPPTTIHATPRRRDAATPSSRVRWWIPVRAGAVRNGPKRQPAGATVACRGAEASVQRVPVGASLPPPVIRAPASIAACRCASSWSRTLVRLVSPVDQPHSDAATQVSRARLTRRCSPLWPTTFSPPASRLCRVTPAFCPPTSGSCHASGLIAKKPAYGGAAHGSLSLRV
jgi:hypothetical protein